MKKTLFALIGIMAMTLTSCLPESNLEYSIYYARVATIDTSTPTVSFKADCTGEIFDNISNLKTPEDLAMFNLEGAKRAEIVVRVDVDASYEATLFMDSTTKNKIRKIDILPVTNKVPTTEQMPLKGIQSHPLTDRTVWVSDGYLNVLPVVPSENSATYYLMPEKVVSDSLFFNLTATYKENSEKELYEYIHCYDLRTLRDTAKADAELRAKMAEILKAMEQQDSMRIVLTSDFIEYDYNHQGKDTIRTINAAVTNYFKYDF